jgi:phosphoglycolate phosphatase
MPRPLPRPSVLIFDLDGTLVDSHPEIASTLRDAIAACGLAPIPPLPRSAVGPPLDALLERVLPGATPQERALVRASFVRLYDASDHRATVVFPGVREGLARWRAAGLRTFVATAKREAATRRLLAALGLGPFDAVACVDGDARGARSKSQLVGDLVAAHGLTAEETWMVGDTASDLLAAHDHGLIAVAASYGYGSDALAAGRPDATIETFTGLLDLVAAASAEVA